MSRKGTPQEIAELRKLLASVYPDVSGDDAFEIWCAALADFPESLNCYRLVAAKMQAEALQASNKQVMQVLPKS